MGSVMGSVSMDPHGSRGERLSAFIDGEGFDAAGHVDDLVSGLNGADRAVWSEYHLIGDALRSVDLAVNPAASSAFLRGFAARFEAEPHVLVPAEPSRRNVKRLTLFGRRVVPSLAVAAAAATLTWIVVPQLQHADGQQAALQTAAVTARHDPAQTVVMTTSASGSAGAAGEFNIIRDARLDQYLEAHQQFAQQPVVPGSAPFIRAAALTSQGQ
jgi:sigma-E factor negative regulatory protein RseA